MKIYVCLESVLNDQNLRNSATQLYDSGHTIILACTPAFRNSFAFIKDFYDAIKILKNKYHTLNFCKSDYDIIIDSKIIQNK